MNSKLLIFLSLLIALLSHILIFNFSVVLFPIDPAEPKPKFFFLGPILQQSDVDLGSSEDDTSNTGPVASRQFDHEETGLKNIHYEIVDPEKKPFMIQTIRKPLVLQTTEKQDRAPIKSIFPSPSEEEKSEEIRTEDSNKELNIQPYRPLRPRRL